MPPISSSNHMINALRTRVTSLDTNHVFMVALFSFLLYPRALDLYIALMHRLALAYMSHLHISRPSRRLPSMCISAPPITFLSITVHIFQSDGLLM
jgi:hypothetical protein